MDSEHLTTSALLLPTLEPTLLLNTPVSHRPANTYDEVWQEAGYWQQVSRGASAAEMISAQAGHSFVHWVVSQPDGTEGQIPMGGQRPPREHNRVLELHGMMGAIGEQLLLAWVAEQDVQRVEMTAAERANDLVTTMLGRAHAELASHFLLGASHSLGNLVLRFMLLDSASTSAFARAHRNYREADFAPHSDARQGWLTFNKTLVSELQAATRLSSSAALRKMVIALDELRDSAGYRGLDDRRGMDYHRRRPQSVPHTAPRAGTWSEQNGHESIALVAPQLEPEARLPLVHQAVEAALLEVAAAMTKVRHLAPVVFTELGIVCATDFGD